MTILRTFLFFRIQVQLPGSTGSRALAPVTLPPLSGHSWLKAENLPKLVCLETVTTEFVPGPVLNAPAEGEGVTRLAPGTLGTGTEARIGTCQEEMCRSAAL